MNEAGLQSAGDPLEIFCRYRQRRQALFSMLDEHAYYSRPIPLRNPIVFYQGHIAAFAYNALVRQASHGPALDPQLENLFARGIDPPEGQSTSRARGNEDDIWPSRRAVEHFCQQADDAVATALQGLPPGPSPQREAAWRLLEHEAMHHETLMYLWQQIPIADKQAPSDYHAHTAGNPPSPSMVHIPAGEVQLGIAPSQRVFAWDNELPEHRQTVPAFSIHRHKVSNHDYRRFVECGGYEDPRWWSREEHHWLESKQIRHPLLWLKREGQWWWRGMFAEFPLPEAWPVWVSHTEASAYARWQGMRLPTEAEYQRATFTEPDGSIRDYPWGHAYPNTHHGVFDFTSWDPQPLATHPDGCSAWGLHDVVGNGWEWTCTPFAPFPGFQAMSSYPEYSADFFDGEHIVLKGASPVTPKELLRPSFRNWFRPRYPYVFAGFRCATGAMS
ncbi:MAG: ergothioneine biosynthesis protein EgtB [Planctomycetota bacterium]|nr:MAG: ergothioneine biosynthesis protein EgtB [Planctomycetota bacterium]